MPLTPEICTTITNALTRVKSKIRTSNFTDLIKCLKIINKADRSTLAECESYVNRLRNWELLNEISFYVISNQIRLREKELSPDSNKQEEKRPLYRIYTPEYFKTNIQQLADHLLNQNLDGCFVEKVFIPSVVISEPPQYFKEYTDALGKNTSLKVLSLEMDFNYSALVLLANALAKHPGITMLNLGYYNQQPHEKLPINDIISKNKLTHLFLNNFTLNRKQVKYFAEALTQNHSLSTLYLPRNSWPLVVDFLKKNVSITTLYIPDYTVRHQNMLIELLKDNIYLTNIKLDVEKVPDQANEYLERNRKIAEISSQRAIAKEIHEIPEVILPLKKIILEYSGPLSLETLPCDYNLAVRAEHQQMNKHADEILDRILTPLNSSQKNSSANSQFFKPESKSVSTPLRSELKNILVEHLLVTVGDQKALTDKLGIVIQRELEKNQASRSSGYAEALSEILVRIEESCNPSNLKAESSKLSS